MHSAQAPPADVGRFLARHTRWTRPPLCPELELGLADGEALRAAQERRWGAGRPFPYWCVAWPAGQAAARWILDHPEIVRGRDVLDLGAGCAVAAIAAARGGARRVLAADCDPFAAASASRNARRNGVCVATTVADAFERASAWDVIVAADLWYEPFFARRAAYWLAARARAGCRVLLADSGRAHFPKPRRPPLARFAAPASERHEPAASVTAALWMIGGDVTPAPHGP